MLEKNDKNELSIDALSLNGLSCSICYPVEVIEKLNSCGTWTGIVAIELAQSRKATIQNQVVAKGQYKNVTRATIDERKVVRAWNRSRYVKQQEQKKERDPRNYPVPFRRIIAVLPLVRKALRMIGLQEIIRSMESYFDFCTTGGHIWEGQSHGFKSLNGFLEKILTLHKTKEPLWWDVRDTPIRPIDDDHAKLTYRVANSFAQTFMNEEKFEMEVGDKNYAHFMKTASQIVNYINRKAKQGIVLQQKDMIRYLLEFIQTLFNEQSDVIYPSHLSSSSVWAAFPQFLQEKGVI